MFVALQRSHLMGLRNDFYSNQLCIWYIKLSRIITPSTYKLAHKYGLWKWWQTTRNNSKHDQNCTAQFFFSLFYKWMLSIMNVDDWYHNHKNELGIQIILRINADYRNHSHYNFRYKFSAFRCLTAEHDLKCYTYPFYQRIMKPDIL